MNEYKAIIDGREGHEFLKIHKYYLNDKNAKKYVIARLKHFGFNRPAGGWQSGVYNLQSKTAPEVKLGDFKSLIREARITGFLVKADQIIDNNDKIFGGIMNMTSNSEALSMTPIFFNYKEGENELNGPARSHSIENEFTNDIIYFRTMACKNSSNHSFELTSRFYRSYLFACISMIEAFVNRIQLAYTHVANFPIDKLENNYRLDSRIETIYQFTTGKNWETLKSSKEWDHFLRLKKMRNSVIHFDSVYFGIELKEIARNLNYARFGVGRLMRRIREDQNLPSLAFINRICNLPMVTYNSDL